jgi:acyl-CoA reductase-like NAD-dependent aldehyde dehydrogenase
MAFWQDSNLLLIDGGLVPAGGGRTFPSIDPATEAVVGESADATAADAERAIRAARRAFDETDWSTDPKRRAGCLRHLAAAMRDVLEELRELTVREVGVPISMTSGPALEGRSASSTSTPTSPSRTTAPSTSARTRRTAASTSAQSCVSPTAS